MRIWQTLLMQSVRTMLVSRTQHAVCLSGICHWALQLQWGQRNVLIDQVLAFQESKKRPFKTSGEPTA